MLPVSRIEGTPAQWRTIYQEMEDHLAVIQQETTQRMERIRVSILICRKAVDELKSGISSYLFRSPEEEIYFFKDVKPAYFSRLIYFQKLFNLEAGRPAGDSKVWEEPLNRVLERLQYFFNDNSDFCQYYRSGDTYLDNQYFRRGTQDTYLKLDDYYFSYDASFSTSHDLRAAKMLANEKLYVYVLRCLAEMQTGETAETAPAVAHAINWTSTKVSLIELLYALQSAGVFNNGAPDLKQLAAYFERVFHIELGNYYNIFQEIRIRKKNRTSFLDLLKERLVRRMDEADEK